MNFKTIEWDREKLYEQIWTSPLRVVAKEYGLSDVGLAKVCKKLQIPRPGVGYWRRRECGFKVHRPALPILRGDLKLVSHVPIQSPPKPKVPMESLVALEVPPATTTVHRLVAQTARAFAGGHADQFGRVQASNWRLPHLDLRVTAAGMKRALSFMDGLIKLLEANNMTVAVASEREPTATRIHVEGEQIKVLLKEHVRGRKRELNAEERRNHERSPEIYRQKFRWAYQPTNRFVFEIESYSDGQRVWSDSRHDTVEKCMEHIALGIRAAADHAKRLRVEREAERLRREKEERLRQRQQARIDRLKQNVARWEEAERIRSYLAAVRQKAEGHDGGLTEDSPMSRFLAWAHRYADHLDPTGSPPGPDWSDQEL